MLKVAQKMFAYSAGCSFCEFIKPQVVSLTTRGPSLTFHISGLCLHSCFYHDLNVYGISFATVRAVIGAETFLLEVPDKASSSHF